MDKVLKNVDVVIHAAAYAHEGLSVFSPHLICKNIISGSTSVFSAAANNKVKRIIFCSSMARYGNLKPPYFRLLLLFLVFEFFRYIIIHNKDLKK